MHDNKMKIVSDIGGTYARFAQVSGGAPIYIKKYSVGDFPNLESTLMQYCTDHTLAETGELSIAAAGYPDNTVWKITNNPDWVITPADIESAGWRIKTILNDFEAGTYSLPLLTKDDLKTLNTGTENNNSLCLIGAGTGLGLGYFHHPNLVQKTHGGHFPIASLNDEHGSAIKDIRATLNRALVFEDIVSGPGLHKLRDMYAPDKASRLFHEFLGIFAATALVTGHAYGGLYMTGGVITHLIKDGAFDTDRFKNALCFDAVDCVKQDIVNTPVHVITDPYPALRGLIHAQSLSDN